jgi:GT2 family glycosyltransferase
VTQLLSIVVPVHERADLAARCFAALDAWTGDREVVVVDDGSRDAGVAALAASRATDRRYRWLRQKSARGFSAAITRGVAATGGDPILLLNSDTEVRSGGERALAGAFARDAAVGAVAARLVYPDGAPQWSGGREPTLAWLFAQASGLGERRGARRRRAKLPPSGWRGGEVEWAPAAALSIRRAAWSATGPFDERFAHYAQDLDYGHRLRAAGFRIRVEPELVVMHHHGGSAAGDAARGVRLDLLWTDLLKWIDKARGAAAARRARRVLVTGVRLRRLFFTGADPRERARIDAALAALAGPAIR